MDLLYEPPRGYDAVAKAFAMARHLPGPQRAEVQVGLACGGVLFARGLLAGEGQAAFFSEHLRDLGWREHLAARDDEMFGCELVFSHPGEPTGGDAEDDDPSFIRRAPVLLWGDEDAADH